ncbi:MAG: hypothetical protein KJ626_16320 [Verrucomicrobia bacterium]|nr:hypothetical protein [Verrucomicrobiota bacterium]
MKVKFLILALACAAMITPALAEESAKKTDSYPLDTCVVSGEPLGSMGDYYVFQHEGREVRFCCSSCKRKFLKNPEKYLKKLDDAAKEHDAAVKAETGHDGHRE